jgi:hypothetical protein
MPVILKYEAKNIAGQLLIKERKNVTQIWKVDLPQGSIIRHTIYVMDNGNPSILQDYVSAAMRNMVYDSIVKDWQENKADTLVVPYLYCYSLIDDDSAEFLLRQMNFNHVFLEVAKKVAQLKCADWNLKYNYEQLRHEDPIIEAYQHGWGLKVPRDVIVKGINPFQFYKFILKR